MTRKLCGAAIALLLALSFLAASRGAYRGYFSGDDLDNLQWNVIAMPFLYLDGIVSPRYFPNHFRPVGHLTYHILGKAWGENYPVFVAAIHLLHFVNTTLLWMLLRRLGLSGRASLAGAAFFLFPMAAFAALWKPMYVFDLWCCLFTLACFLAWIANRCFLGLVFFWLAYKSKELAVMIPFALAGYEFWLGERRWKRIIPFFLISASFTLQGLLLNRHAGDDYTMQFGVASVLKTISFYGSHILIYPWLALLLVALPKLVPDKRVYFGLSYCALLLGPLIFLPSRMFDAYLYAPMAGLAIAVAATSGRFHWGWTAAAFAFWIPFNYHHLRIERKGLLAMAEENRAYVSQVNRLPARLPSVRRFVYDGYPADLHSWGVRGALLMAYGPEEKIEILSMEDRNLTSLLPSNEAMAILYWDNPFRNLSAIARTPGQPDLAYLTMGRLMPIWQLLDGWYQNEGRFRWTKPRATATLWRPAKANQFEIEVNAGPKHIADLKEVRLKVLVDGSPIGSAEFTSPGWQIRRFPVSPGPARNVTVEIQVDPEYRPSQTDPRVLGIAVGGFGFLAPEEGK